jgi:hypothetical protein
MKKLLLALLCFPLLAQAEYKDWDKWDKEMFWTTTALIAVDHLTTRDMASRYDEGYTEKNPLLGKRPDIDTVDIFFLVNYISHYYITDYLTNEEHRAWYLTARFVVNGAASVNNLSIGLGLRF